MGRRFSRIIGSLAAAIAISITLGACSSSSGSYASPEAVQQMAGVRDMAMVEDAGADSYMQSSPAMEPSIVRTGNAYLTVLDPLKSADEVTDIVASLGGSVADRSVNRSSDGTARNAELYVKVPSQKFDDFFRALNDLGTMTHDSRQETDVTLEHVDLKARVESLEASIDRLKELLQGAEVTSDLVEIETALGERQQELDALKAQLKYLEDQISYSAVWVSLSTDQVIPDGPTGFFDAIVIGIKSIWTAIKGGVIVAGLILPWLVVVGAITWLVIFIVRVSRRKKTQPPAV